jgi:hypothetical protein
MALLSDVVGIFLSSSEVLTVNGYFLGCATCARSERYVDEANSTGNENITEQRERSEEV